MRRVLLVRQASTRAMRRACFAPDDPLDARGRSEAEALRAVLAGGGETLVSPCLAAFQTASLAGRAPLVTVPALADCDYGRWSGRALDDVERAEPEAVEAWLTDPDAAPHGGESVRALLARVATWLEGQALRTGSVVAVTPGSFVKAAVVTAFDAPAATFWRVDVAPASVTELHARDGPWTVSRVNDRAATCARAAAGGGSREGHA
jgi:broad specificity phosphatase PhoE